MSILDLDGLGILEILGHNKNARGVEDLESRRIIKQRIPRERVAGTSTAWLADTAVSTSTVRAGMD